MSKKRMVVSDDQLLVDMELIFNAIREANGDWEQVEQEMRAYLEAVPTKLAVIDSLSCSLTVNHGFEHGEFVFFVHCR